jgi:hypothetical protein
MRQGIVCGLLLAVALVYADAALARDGGSGSAGASAGAGAPSGAAAGATGTGSAGAGAPSGAAADTGTTGATATGGAGTGAPGVAGPGADVDDNSAMSTGPGDGLGGSAAGYSINPEIYRSPAQAWPGSNDYDYPAASPRGTFVPGREVGPAEPLMCPGVNASDPRRC